MRKLKYLNIEKLIKLKIKKDKNLYYINIG